MKSFTARRFCGTLIATVLLMAGAVSAATKTWDTVTGDGGIVTDGSGDWTGGNWNTGSGDTTWISGDTAIIGGGILGAAGTITLTTAVTNSNGITFNVPNGGGGYVVAGNTLILTGTPNLNVNAGSAEISSTLAGSVGLDKRGTGTLVLSNPNNPFTGSISVSDGGSLIVTGTNAAPLANVGTVTSGNRVELRPGARLTSSAGSALSIGGTGGNDNTVSVSAPGTSGARTLDPSSSYIGGAGNNNTMIVSNGASFRSRSGYQVSSAGWSNALVLAGSSTVMTVDNNNGSAGNVADGGQYNCLIVSNGASMNTRGFVGVGAGANTACNWVRITGTGSVWNFTAGNSGFIVGSGVGATSNSFILDDGGRVTHAAPVANNRNYGIGCANGANWNWISVGSNSTMALNPPQVPVIGGYDNGGIGMPVDMAATNNHLDLVDGGAFTCTKNFYLMGANSAFNLGNGNGISSATVGFAPSTETTNGVVLYKADSRLNINGGRLVANAPNYMVFGPGQVVISGAAWMYTDQGDSVIQSAITGSAGALIKDGASGGFLTCQNVAGFTGNMTVSRGTLKVLGDTGSPSAGLLSLTNDTVFNIADGTARTNTFSGMSLTGPCTLCFDYDSGAVNTDVIAVNSAVTGSGSITIDLGSPSGPASGTYTLISAPGGGLSAFAFTPINHTGGTLGGDDNTLTVTWGVVEPALGTGYWYGGVATPVNSMSATNWSRTNDVYVSAGRTPTASDNIEFSCVGASQQASIIPGGSMSVSNVTFNDSTPVVIAADGSTLTINGAVTANENAAINAAVNLVGTSPSTVFVAGGRVFTLGNAILGNTLAKTGAGTLRLTATNTLTALPLISSGTLSIEAGGKLTGPSLPIGDVSDNVSVVVNGSGSRLTITDPVSFLTVGSVTAGNSLIVTNGGVVAWSQTSAGYDETRIGESGGANNNTVTVTGLGSLWSTPRYLVVGKSGSGNGLIVADGGSVRCWRGFIGSLGGGNSVTVTGTGSTFTCEGPNQTQITIGSGSGNSLSVDNGGLVNMSMDNSLIVLQGSGSVLNLGNGTGIGTINAGWIDLNSANAQLNINGGMLTMGGVGGAGTVNLIGKGYISMGGRSTSIDSVINGGAGGTLIKEGSGSLQLNNANAYYGDTVITDGRVLINNSLAVQNSTVSNATSGGVTFGAVVSATFGGLSGNGGIALTNTAGSNVVISVGNNGSNTIFSGVLSGGGGLEKIGTGSLTISASNTYRGATSISGGTLAMAAGASIASANIVIAAGGRLDVSGTANYVMAGENTYTFGINAADSGSAGRLDAAILDIGNANVVLSISGTLDDHAYILASYTSIGGSGSTFASVTGLPSGYVIDYNYNDWNMIAVVQALNGTTLIVR